SSWPVGNEKRCWLEENPNGLSIGGNLAVNGLKGLLRKLVQHDGQIVVRDLPGRIPANDRGKRARMASVRDHLERAPRRRRKSTNKHDLQCPGEGRGAGHLDLTYLSSVRSGQLDDDGSRG